ncbi:hypothetical protein HYH02_008127 [Chlamydomonas schloesseri]|uniref:Ankyrin repeat domain-containing protein n=1 Tax=Chlamydomonas schloesseri TaxID=2026947 RepID=A0A835WGN1_9CHLO|nr:hypothetical protein HYH02_008127 [Chlamydomonas schloesseri]|eukprot:KAG2446973.1 hypothetical protein HYH02_008127 [Chlamydomonas schloesseri]
MTRQVLWEVVMVVVVVVVVRGGDAASFDVAIWHCGCLPDADMLAAAAHGGGLHACRALLLRHCCSWSPAVMRAAASAGQLDVVKWLEQQPACREVDLADVAGVAARAGHGQVVCSLIRAAAGALDWSQLAGLQAQAARGGHVELLEHLLLSDRELAERAAAQSDGATAPDRAARASVLEAISSRMRHAGGAEGQPVEQQADEGPPAAPPSAAQVAGTATTATGVAAAAARRATWGAVGQKPLLAPLSTVEKARLLAAAAASGTPCWWRKVDLLLERHWAAGRGGHQLAPRTATATASTAAALPASGPGWLADDIATISVAIEYTTQPPYPPRDLLEGLLRRPDTLARLQLLDGRGV